MVPVSDNAGCNTSSFPRGLLLVAAVALLLPQTLSAQQERYELGVRLKRYEQTWERVNDDARKRTVTLLNEATQSFFSFRLSAAGEKLDWATRKLLLEEPVSELERFCDSLMFLPEARLLDANTTTLPMRVQQFYKVSFAIPSDLRFRYCYSGAEPITLALQTVPRNLDISLPKLPEGTSRDEEFRYELFVVDGKPITSGRFTISRVAELSKRLAALRKIVDGYPKRLTTLEEATIETNLGILEPLAGKSTLEADIPANAYLLHTEAIAAGKPPFALTHAGDFHLALPTRPRLLFRLLIPEGLTAETKVPLVIALHGAGGSQNMFIETYGAGHIVKECRARGWLLVTPSAGIIASKVPIEELIDELKKRLSIDERRIYLVGHSMGAGQAVKLATEEPERYAAVAALGGGGSVTKERVAKLTDVPFFIAAGTEDFARAGAKRLSTALQGGGVRTVQYREYPAVEHLVIVRTALPDTFAFFDKHKRP